MQLCRLAIDKGGSSHTNGNGRGKARCNTFGLVLGFPLQMPQKLQVMFLVDRQRSSVGKEGGCQIPLPPNKILSPGISSLDGGEEGR